MYVSFVCLYALFCWLYQVIPGGRLLGHRMCMPSAFADTSNHFDKVIVPVLYVNFCTNLGAGGIQKE